MNSRLDEYALARHIAMWAAGAPEGSDEQREKQKLAYVEYEGKRVHVGEADRRQREKDRGEK